MKIICTDHALSALRDCSGIAEQVTALEENECRDNHTSKGLKTSAKSPFSGTMNAQQRTRLLDFREPCHVDPPRQPEGKHSEKADFHDRFIK